jgi:proline dehydrogenase
MVDTKIFNNTKDAFVLKTKKDLKRSLFMFRMMNIPFLVPIGIFFTKLALRLRFPVEGLIKKTIFDQFCGGETLDDCMPIIKQM